MKKTRKPKRNRSAEAIAKARKIIEEAGWTILDVSKIKVPTITTAPLTIEGRRRYVAVKRVYEREDESITTLYESDYTIEGLAALVARREREEGRKA